MLRAFADGLRRLLALAVTTALIVPTFCVTPAVAAGLFVGGPTAGMAQFVPNDHTVVGLPWSAAVSGGTPTGLAPNTTYYLKVRLSPQAGTGAENERGWTWNPTTGKWAWVRAQDWTEFPAFQTDADGQINGGNEVWSYFKFGSDDFSNTLGIDNRVAQGYRYFLFIALSTGKSGTLNSTNGPDSGTWPVTVLDMRTDGAKVHNASATGAGAAKLVKAAAFGGNSVYAVSKTEANTVDDDSDGTVDDEDYGLTGNSGDYQLGVPVGARLDLWLDGSLALSDYTAAHADEDIALGAADSSAPASPTALAAVPAEKRIDLSWTPSVDADTHHYNVYRWAVPVLSTPTYSIPRVLIGTSTTAAYTDDSVPVRTGGLTYGYEVRAVDAATNVSARSDVVEAVSQATPPSITAATIPVGPDGDDDWFTKAPSVVLSTPGAAHYSWDDDQAAFGSYTGSLVAPEGTHTLYFFADDVYGNESAVSSIGPLKVDTKAPAAGVVAPSLFAVGPSATTFDVSWSSSDPAPSSGGITYDVESRTGLSGAWQPVADKQGTVDTGLTFTPTAGTTCFFRVRARDAAGNLSVWSQSGGTEVISEGAPSVAVAAPAQFVTSPTFRTFTVTWSKSDPAPSPGPLAYDAEVRTGASGAWQPVAGKQGTADTGLTFTPVAGATYYFRIRARDADGKIGAWAVTSGTTVVALAARAIVTPSAPSGSSGWYKTVPSVALSAAGGRAFYAWDKAAGPYTAYTSPLSAPRGAHVLYYLAKDAAGHPSAVSSVGLKVDTGMPTTKVSGPAIVSAVSSSKDFTVRWGATDPIPSSGGLRYDVEYKVGASGTWRRWKTLTPTASAKMVSALGSTYYFRTRARDAAGNQGGFTYSKAVVVPYDQGALSYGAAWYTAYSSGYFRGSAKYATRRGAWASKSLRGGSAAYLVTTKGPKYGSAKVYIDGRYVRTVSLYSAKVRSRQSVYLGALAGTRVHTIKLVNAPTRGRTRLQVDGLAIRR